MDSGSDSLKCLSEMERNMKNIINKSMRIHIGTEHEEGGSDGLGSSIVRIHVCT